MRTHLYFIFGLIILLPASSCAQRIKVQETLIDEHVQALEAAMIEQVNQFNDYVTLIWARPTETDRQDMTAFRDWKARLVSQTLDLFIAKGEALYAYDTIEVRGNDGRYHRQLDSVLVREAAIMETTSMRNPSKKIRQTVKTYLNKAAGLLGQPTDTYTQVEVTSVELYYIRNLRKTRDGLYEGTISFVQRIGGNIVEDVGCPIAKTVTVCVDHPVVLGEEMWAVKLGDIECRKQV